MKKVLKTFVILIIIVRGLFFTIPLFMDTAYNLKRTVVVNTNKENVKNYMENFQEGSPWVEMDEEMEVEILGEAGSVGSTYE
jgi:hypothetical protein